MLHYVHPPVSYFVCLTFGAEKTVYSEVLELLDVKKLKRTAESGDNSGASSLLATPVLLHIII